jgi:hypothetical protein
MTNLHAREMRAGAQEAWTPYRDETFVIPFSLLCGIYTAEHSIAFRSGDRCPLPLLGPARGQPGPAPRAVTPWNRVDGGRRSNEVPENVRGFSPSHTATAKISRLRQLYAVLVFHFFFNFLPQTSFRTLMTKLHLHRTIRISFLGLASIHFHCILGSTQQLRIR